MSEYNVCSNQFEIAKNDINKSKEALKKSKEDLYQKNNDIKNSENDVNNKETSYNTELKNFKDGVIRSIQNKEVFLDLEDNDMNKCGANYVNTWHGNTEKCIAACNSCLPKVLGYNDYENYFSSIENYEWIKKSKFFGGYKCNCKLPDKSKYDSLKQKMENAKSLSENAKSMINSKKKIYETAKSNLNIIPRVNYNVSCCNNSTSCQVGDDCDRFIENCELKLNFLSLKEKDAEAKVTEAKLAEAKLAEAKLAEEKLAEAKLAEAKLAEAKLAEAKLVTDANVVIDTKVDKGQSDIKRDIVSNTNNNLKQNKIETNIKNDEENNSIMIYGGACIICLSCLSCIIIIILLIKK